MWGLFIGNNIITSALNLVILLFMWGLFIRNNIIKLENSVCNNYHRNLWKHLSIHLVSAKWHHASSLWLLLISIQSYNRKWILFSANKLSKIFKNIKHSFFLCKGEIAALVYTKQNNKIKTQASELYTVINQYRNTVTEAKLSTQD